MYQEYRRVRRIGGGGGGRAEWDGGGRKERKKKKKERKSGACLNSSAAFCLVEALTPRAEPVPNEAEKTGHAIYVLGHTDVGGRGADGGEEVARGGGKQPF